MKESNWECPHCKNKLTVQSLRPDEWQSLRSPDGPVGHWQYKDRIWWHLHKKGYTMGQEIKDP